MPDLMHAFLALHVASKNKAFHLKKEIYIQIKTCVGIVHA